MSEPDGVGGASSSVPNITRVLPVTMLRMCPGNGRSHQNAKAKTAICDDAEGVFVSHIIAKVDRHHLWPLQVKRLAQPEDSLCPMSHRVGAR